MKLSKRQLLPLLVAGLLLLSGCSGVGDPSPAPETPGEETETPSGNLSSFDYPPGASADGMNLTQVANGHDERLGEVESYRFTLNHDQRAAQNDTFRYTFRRDGDATYTVMVDTGANTTVIRQYTRGDTVHRQVETDEVTVNTSQERLQYRNLRLELLASGTEELEFTVERVITIDGEPHVVYVADLEDNKEVLNQSDVEVSEFTVRVTVGEDGLIDRYRYLVVAEQNGRESSLDVRYTLEGVNNTTVERPAWALPTHSTDGS